MRRAVIPELEVDRLRDLAADAGISLRIAVDLDGEATFVASGLGTYGDLVSLERALADAMRAAA